MATDSAAAANRPTKKNEHAFRPGRGRRCRVREFSSLSCSLVAAYIVADNVDRRMSQSARRGTASPRKPLGIFEPLKSTGTCTLLVRLVTDVLLLTSFFWQSAYLRRSDFVGSVPVTVRTVFLLPSQPGRRNCLCFLGTSTPGQQAAPLGPPAATRYSLPPLPVKLRGFSRFGRPGFGLWVCNCAIVGVARAMAVRLP